MSKGVVMAIAVAAALGATAILPPIVFANAYTFDDIIKRETDKLGLPFILVKGMIAKESSFRPTAVPRKPDGTLASSARGLMQVTTAALEDVNRVYRTGYTHAQMFDPEINIIVGTRYLKMMVNQFGLLDGVRAYYEGPGNRRKNIDGKPTEVSLQRAKESAPYLSKIMGFTLAFALDPRTHSIA